MGHLADEGISLPGWQKAVRKTFLGHYQFSGLIASITSSFSGMCLSAPWPRQGRLPALQGAGRAGPGRGPGLLRIVSSARRSRSGGCVCVGMCLSQGAAEAGNVSNHACTQTHPISEITGLGYRH